MNTALNFQIAPALKRELLLLLPAGWACILATYVPFSIFRDFQAEQWLLQAGLLWCLVWQQIWQRASLNHPIDGSVPYSALGWANRLTLLRGGLIALAGGFLFQPEATGALGWLPALLYALAAILDRIDGYVARRSRQTSLLGSELDTVLDALGLLVAPLLAVGYGRIHWSFLLVSAAYYLFRLGLHWRRQRDLPVHELGPNALRRVLAGFQMGFLAVVLLPIFKADTDGVSPGPIALTQLAGMAFMVPVLAGFAVDWLVASGRLSLQRPAVVHFFERLAGFSRTIFQPALRLAAFVAIVILLRDTGMIQGSVILHATLLVCAALMLAGFATRLAALALTILLSWLYPPVQEPALYALIVCSVWILLLGSGRFSLWQGEDQWVNRYDGP